MILKEFQYPVDADERIVRKGKLPIEGNSLTIDVSTAAGSKDGITKKPNEDTFSVIQLNNTLLAAVFDGCSSQKPIADLKDETGAHFASHFLKFAFEKSTKNTPNRIIRELNKKLLEKSMHFEGTTLTDIHTFPATTATLVQIDVKNELVNISHVGDTFCILQYGDNHTEFVTVDRNRKYDEKRFALIKKIADEKHITPRVARKDERVNKAIREMFQESFNKADGSGQGVINGDPKVEQYIQDVSFQLTEIKSLLIGSDGLIPPGWDTRQTHAREKIFKILETGGVEGLIHRKQEIEDNDPDWRFVRYKHSDDATGIYIKIAHKSENLVK